MSKRSNELPIVVKSPKKKGKFIKFVAFVGICSAGAYYINKFIQKQKEQAASDFEGEQHICRFTGKEIKKGEGETVPNMRLVCTFSGLYLDLSKATIESDVSFEIENVFSGISIRIPDGINVQVDCTGAGSGINTPGTYFEGAPTLFIHGKNRCSGLSVFVKADAEENDAEEASVEAPVEEASEQASEPEENDAAF